MGKTQRERSRRRTSFGLIIEEGAGIGMGTKLGKMSNDLTT